MPRLLLSSSLLLLAACSSRAPAQAVDAPPPLAREFRAAWVATVDNIDFPSRRGLSADALRGELDAIVARAVELKLNALVFQVRPAADAFYRSRLEPWSEYLTGTQGKEPPGGFDPLAHLIARCHEHGLLLHAWFNPFRSWHHSGKSAPHATHVSQKAPQLVVQYGRYQWMDPGDPLAAKWSLATVQDVVQNYDVDGVHLDDYFYPYPEPKQTFADEPSYAAYRERGGKLGKSDWRRANIDDYVQRLYGIVHDAKPHVAVGISPFGIARPGVPKDIQAGIDQYEQLAADVPKWLRAGWVDYLTPQLYWPIDQKPQAFEVLVKYWHRENPLRRGMWPGLYTGKALAQEKNWRADELADQIAVLRAADPQPGHVHFSFRALRSDAAHVAGALRDRVYREVAIAPAMPWLGDAAPAAVVPSLDGDRRTVRWSPATDARFVAVQVRERGTWRTFANAGGSRTSLELPANADAVALTPVSRTGVTGPTKSLRIR